MDRASVTIDAGHNGPPRSAHGGVTVGRLAELVGPGDGVEVRLLAPPPLETPMLVQAAGETPGARDHGADRALVASVGDLDIATVRSLTEPLEVGGFGLLAPAELDSAAGHFRDFIDGSGHSFPTCFGCGPRRGPEALRQFTGIASDGDTLARFRVDGEGALPDWLTIAGLDCPSGWTVFLLVDPTPEAVVLGTMRCRVNMPATAGVDHQVRGRLLSSEGRKHSTEVAMLDPGGEVVAEARTVWIEIDPAKLEA